MNWRTNRARLLLPGLILAIAGGCIEREGRPVNPCTQVTVAQQIQVDSVNKVDLLFMVDNSNSMKEEQESLAAELPRMVQILSSGDFELDGDLNGPNDFKPVESLNVGVITSDMGTGGYVVPTCTEPNYGDDGLLRTTGATYLDPNCMTTYPSFMTFEAGSGVDPADFAADVACVARAGLGGCGFEQQLEAILKALTPDRPTSWTADNFHRIGQPNGPAGLERPFFGNATPHGDGANAGFVRENSVLAIIPVTDEEDCSVYNPDIFDELNPAYRNTNLNLRCFFHADEVLHPVARYVNGLIQLRKQPNHLVYAPIVGIPPDLAPGPGEAPDYDALIHPDPNVRDPRMWETVDQSMPTQLTPSCSTDRGVAFPPVRIVETAKGLAEKGAGVTVQSICQESFENALTEVIRQIKSALGEACLPRPLNVEGDGRVSCEVLSVMPPDTPCEGVGQPKLDADGNPLMEASGEGDNAPRNRAVCVIPQLTPTSDDISSGRNPEGTGWFYDNYTDEGRENCQDAPGEPYQRIAFAGTQPPPGATVRLECFLSVQGDSTNTDEVQIGTFCDPDSGADICAAAKDPNEKNPLSCDPIQRTCGVTCETDSDCREAGLIGYVCDTTPLSQLSDDYEGNDAAYNFCVNPTCS